MTRRERRPGVATRTASESRSTTGTKHNGQRRQMPPTKVSNLVVKRQRLDWKGDVLPVAKAIVESYDTAVTLRQLFYRLVSLKDSERGRIPNTYSMYTVLAHNTAQARYEGTFPDLIDQGRKITVPASWDSPQDAMNIEAGRRVRANNE